MAKPMTVSCVRRRILRTFCIHRRWMGPYLIRFAGWLASANDGTFGSAIKRLLDEGLLIGVWDDRPGCGFPVYLTTDLLPPPEELAQRCPPSRERGWLRCHARSES